jgi:hypothetical protein
VGAREYIQIWDPAAFELSERIRLIGLGRAAPDGNTEAGPAAG